MVVEVAKANGTGGRGRRELPVNIWKAICQFYASEWPKSNSGGRLEKQVSQALLAALFLRMSIEMLVSKP